MNEDRKPRAIITIAVFDSGEAAISSGSATVPDLVMAAGLLTREADHAFSRVKMTQAVNQGKIQTAPAIPGLKVRG